MIRNRLIYEKRRNRTALIRCIAQAEERKLIIRNAAINHNQQLFKTKEICRASYESGAFETYKERPVEYWNDYYDKQIEKYEAQISKIDSSIERTEITSRYALYTFIAIFMMVGGFYTITNIQSTITGFATSDTTANVTVQNAPPTLNVSITPSIAYTNDSLFCNTSTYDANLDSVSVSYRWFNDDALDVSLDNLSTILGTNTTKGENWTCEATPFDGTSNGTSKNASIIISNSPINITLLEITDIGRLPYSQMTLTPIAGARSNTSIRATIFDIDNATNQSVTAYLCDTADYSTCSDSSYTYAINLTYLEDAPGADEFYYSFNGSAGMPEFYKASGTWKLYVKVVDEAFSDNNETDFTFVQLKAINYSDTVTLGQGIVSLGNWSNGTNKYLMTNWGNVNLSINWNASDPVGPEDTWQLNGTDFMLDDDVLIDDDTNNLVRIFLNATNKTFEPASGLIVCQTSICANENATLNTSYHIAPPAGLKAGTYNTTITIVLYTK